MSVSNDLQSTILEYTVPRQRARVFDEVPYTPVDGVYGTSSKGKCHSLQLMEYTRHLIKGQVPFTPVDGVYAAPHQRASAVHSS